MIKFPKKISEAEARFAEHLLSNWNTMSKNLGTCDKDSLCVLLSYELAHSCRMAILQRLIARYSSLERKENENALYRALL